MVLCLRDYQYLEKRDSDVYKCVTSFNCLIDLMLLDTLSDFENAGESRLHVDGVVRLGQMLRQLLLARIFTGSCSN